MRQLIHVYQLGVGYLLPSGEEVSETKGHGAAFELPNAKFAADCLLRLFDLRGPRDEDFKDDEDNVNWQRAYDFWCEKVESKPWYSKERVDECWKEAEEAFRFFTSDGEDFSVEALSDFAHAAYGKQCEILGFCWDKQDVPRIRLVSLPDPT